MNMLYIYFPSAAEPISTKMSSRLHKSSGREAVPHDKFMQAQRFGSGIPSYGALERRQSSE
jgi:hypothetical protein